MNFGLKNLRWLLIVFLLLASMFLIRDSAARYEDGTPRGVFARLQARAQGRLQVNWHPVTNVPDFLSGSNAADRIPYTPTAAERGNPIAIARGFLDEQRALFKLTSADELKPLRVEADAQLGHAHVRLNQMYHGIPVYGKQLIVHIDQKDQITAVNGHYMPDLDLPTQPKLNAAMAERTAQAHLLSEELDAAERATTRLNVLQPETQLMIYVDDKGKATLTWRVVIMSEEPLGQWLYFVHANRPLVVFHFDGAAHDKVRRTYSAGRTTSIPGRLLIEEGERSRDEIAQAAHDGAGKVYDYYFQKYKRDSVDGRGGELISTVHYGSSSQDSENAAWIGQYQQMIYGDGGRIFKPLPLGLDVVGHEFTHGLTDNTAALEYVAQSGALNESYSDVFAAMIDRKDWTIGEDVMLRAPYLRSLEDPSAGGQYDPRNPLAGSGQPGHMREYANLPNSRRSDNGGVHINSGIPNKAAFLIAQAIGREKTEQIYYRTLTQYLTPQSDFADMVRATLRAAQELYPGDVNAVQNGFAQVGLANAPSQTRPQPQQPPSRGNTPPPPPSQSAAGCNNLIVNSGFENDRSGWVEVSAQQQQIIDTELPHTGARSAWLGGQDEERTQYIYQDVSIPANVNSAKLKYWRFLHEEKRGLSGLFAEDATFWAIIATPTGDPQATLEEVVSREGDDTWREKEYDLSQFAGKKIRIAFVSGMVRGNISSYFVDDVELQACTTGQQQQPQATGNTVFVQGVVKNADTGRGIEGAKVFILKPGVSADQAAEDDQVTREEVLTTGISDATGFYRTEAAVPKGQNYSVIVIASGHRPIVANEGIKIPANASNTWTVNATLRPSR